eukprot:gb/GECG01013741.1/.p1 GENE.gb/GECG01013741.1/~~gb/GECG01013741.1/.p1  ORF type:complete len:298 (+),score=38.14 gb/GECG01013741.1/:1-894(+)
MTENTSEELSSCSFTWPAISGTPTRLFSHHSSCQELTEVLEQGCSSAQSPAILKQPVTSVTTEEPPTKCEVLVQFKKHTVCSLQQIALRSTARNAEFFVTFWDDDEKVELPWRYLATTSAKRLENAKVALATDENQSPTEFPLYAASRQMPAAIQGRKVKQIKVRLLSITTKNILVFDKLAIVAPTQQINEDSEAEQSTPSSELPMAQIFSQLLQSSSSRSSPTEHQAANTEKKSAASSCTQETIQGQILQEMRQMRHEMNTSLARLHKRVEVIEQYLKEQSRGDDNHPRSSSETTT